MLKICSIILMALVGTAALGQEKDYVCTPCGQDCDKTVLKHGGTCASCGMVLVEKSSVKIKNLGIDELCQRLAANPRAVLLDVRTPGEFDGSSGVASFGHFKNAINVNIDQLPDRLDILNRYKDQEVIVYCSHSHRSPRAAHYLTTQGFTNVSNFSGGVSTLKNKDKNDCLKSNFVFHTR